MRKYCLGIFLLLFAIIPVYSDVRSELGNAVENYKSENYEEAIKIYENILLENFVNPTIYYNLANLYLHVNEIGKASLNIERALRFTPRDQDIRYLKSYISKQINEPQQNIAEKIIEQLKMLFNLNEITFIVWILFFLFTGFLILYFILYKKVWLNFAILFVLCFALIVPIFYLKIEDELLNKQAVVLVDTDVRNKPSLAEESSFKIESGKKVVVLEELGRWAQVKLSIEGLSGWIDKHALEMI